MEVLYASIQQIYYVVDTLYTSRADVQWAKKGDFDVLESKSREFSHFTMSSAHNYFLIELDEKFV